MNKLEPFVYYDWKKTILKNKKENYSINEIVPKTFYKELNGGKVFKSKLNGTWKSWHLTDEAEGPHPILKCTIDDGYLEISTKDSYEKHSLKDVEIKICMTIRPNSDGTYSLYKDSFYIKNNSLNVSESDLIISHHLDKLILTYFKDNLKPIELFINNSRIQTKTEENLSLLGWDIESAISYTNMNEIIKKDNLYEKKFHQYIKVRRNEFTIDGTFGPWQMTTGADGQNIRFKCPIESATYTINEDKYIAKPDNFIIIQVDLKYFDSKTTITDPTGLNNGQQFNLKVKTDNTENLNNVIISGSNITDVNDEFYPEDSSSLELVFRKWFNENIAKFEQIFSYILLNETAKDPNYQWLKPTQISYGSASKTKITDENTEIPDLDKSVFAAMAMVENHENNSPDHAVDGRLLKNSNSQCAFAISMPEFLEHFLLTGLQATQINPLNTFEVYKENLMITNKEKMNFGKIEANNTQVDTIIEKNNFQLSIQNNKIIIEIIDATWQQVKGVTGHFNYRQAYNLTLKKVNNEYKPIIVEDGEPILSYMVTEEAWKLKQDAIISGVTSIFTSVLLGAATQYGANKFSKFLQSKVKKSNNKVSIKLNSSESKYLWDNMDVDPTYLKNVKIKNSKEAWTELDNMSLNGSTSSQNILLMKNTAKPFGQRIKVLGIKLLAGVIASFGYSLGAALPSVLKDIINANINNDFNVLPGVQAFAQECLGAVQWPDNSELKVDFAALQGVYLLRGNLVKNNTLDKK
ncbi:clostridium P-47 family protein [Clostridium baratii str. Sullivan]|uniref:Clostridium P-47 family protein n=2 Tax=Clostridium baratii TaxID=1561 RepID=A0A0A7FWR6_9CLOT|nr:TULIP family P47-like protein [Clostridium baratii]AGR53836.1 toxin complex component ORF-X2 [Clostridium baratii]AIY84033.1 clostridium P-47 family protein [Clostridium baratii str. Sullivan]